MTALALLFRIIGMILLFLLALIGLVLLILLLVPVRYRGRVLYQDKFTGQMQAAWLFHLLRLSASYDDELSWEFRILGRRLTGSEKEEDEEEALSGDMADQEIWPDETDAGGQAPASGMPASDGLYAGQLPERKAVRSRSGRDRVHREGKRKDRDNHLAEKWKHLCDRLQSIKEKTGSAIDWWEDEVNQNMVALAFRQLKKLVRHITPGHLAGHARVGLEDPYRTGQICQAVVWCYPLWGEQFDFEPEFAEKILDIDAAMRGRIRLGTVLWIFLRMLGDKGTRRLLGTLTGRKRRGRIKAREA